MINQQKVQQVLDVITEMRVSRGWDKTDTMAVLIKSVSAEAAELLETIQWSDDNYNIDEVKSELADVLMYALSICIDNNWDVEELISEKIKNVYMRYPEKND